MKQTRENLADLTEMVFEHRNRAYGAYVLRKNYSKHLFRSLLLVIGTLLALLVLSGFKQNAPVDGPKLKMSTVEFTAIDEVMEKPKMEEKVKFDLPEPPKISTTKHLIPDPTPEDLLEEEEKQESIHDLNTLAAANMIGTQDIEGEEIKTMNLDDIIGDGTGIPEIIRPEPEPSSDEFVAIDEPPVPINMAAVWSKATYPKILSQNAQEGQVILRILIDREGKYLKHKILNSSHPLFTREVEKHVSRIRFTPAVQGGKAIKFWVNLPFSFKLMN